MNFFKKIERHYKVEAGSKLWDIFKYDPPWGELPDEVQYSDITGSLPYLDLIKSGVSVSVNPDDMWEDFIIEVLEIVGVKHIAHYMMDDMGDDVYSISLWKEPSYIVAPAGHLKPQKSKK